MVETSTRESFDRAMRQVRRSARFAWLGLLVTAAGVAGTAAYVSEHEPTYLSETSVLYREVIPTNLIRDRDVAGRDRSMSARLREALLARPLLLSVIEENDLDDRDAGGPDAAVEQLRERITFRDRGGNTFRIGYRGRSPEEAQRVSAGLVALLLEWEKRIQLEAVTITREFFTAERDNAESALADAELALATFLSAHPEFAVEPAAGNGGSERAIGTSIRAAHATRPGDEPTTASQVNPEAAALARQRDRLRARLAQLDRPTVRPRPPVEVIRADRELEAATTALEELELRFTYRHPDVIRARARVRAARARRERLTPAPSATPPPDPGERAAIQRRLDTLDAAIAASRRKPARPIKQTATAAADDRPLDAIVELEAEHVRLVRRLGELRDRYRSIESKLYTAEITAASEAARQSTLLTIIDPANLPTGPAGVPESMILLFGVIASLGLGVAVALLLGSLNDRVFEPADLAPLLDGAAPSFCIAVPGLRRSRR